MVNLCIPTLNRYDLLDKLIESAEQGTVVPDQYFVIDNGGKYELKSPKVFVYTPQKNLGVAGSWNVFLKVVPEIRVISNDDLLFLPNTLEELINGTKPGTVTYVGQTTESAFSLYLIDDECVAKVGYFDEHISPGYAYFEDNDYAYRLRLIGDELHKVTTSDYIHVGSATLKAFDSVQMGLHHGRFVLARKNYIAKWGGLPGAEKYKTPYNK